MEGYSGNAPYDEAVKTLTDRIDRGIPVPFLLLGLLAVGAAALLIALDQDFIRGIQVKDLIADSLI